ncbi:hypothetical protein RND71_034425 [Anisodus tanguticus]|uniref:Uncharacterized protein n=1 Tax=Anisodus tanguticus TaxID=243964 RepID=A0AAE1V2K0_9SOLA|nr:hypothetical protein RND71_034425 [Anisodus tanguticus]
MELAAKNNVFWDEVLKMIVSLKERKLLVTGETSNVESTQAVTTTSKIKEIDEGLGVGSSTEEVQHGSMLEPIGNGGLLYVFDVQSSGIRDDGQNETLHVFDEISQSNLSGCFKKSLIAGDANNISWNPMIGGYARNSILVEELKLFRQILIVNVKPLEVSFLVILPTHGHLMTLHIRK